MQKNPSIRFKGFTDAWEQRKLKDVAPLQRGFDLPKSKINEGPYPVLFSNGIGGWNSEYKAKAPGVVTGRSGSIGNVVFVEQNYWPHNTSLWVTSFFDNYPLYIYYLYQHVDLSKFGTGSGVPTLNRNDVHDHSVIIPNPDEQTCIANFFKQLDDTIDLHLLKQRQLELLKQCLIKEILPQKDSVFPHLRLANFRDPWEQHQLKDVLKVNSGRDYKHLDEGNIPVYGTGGYMLSVDGKLSDVDGIGLGRKGTIDKPQYLKAPFWTVDTLFYLTPFPNYDIYFLYTLIQSINWKSMDESTGVPSLSKSVIERVTLTFPILEEQRKIGFVFKQLDDTIALHQQKVTHLKTLKGTLLNKMFI